MADTGNSGAVAASGAGAGADAGAGAGAGSGAGAGAGAGSNDDAGSGAATLRVVVVPGNGCTMRVQDALWYGWLGQQLEAQGVEVAMHTMPDPVVARESVWIPFMRDHLKVGATTIVVGHSSGAEAAMRFAETDEVAGIVLVAACYTDLGDAHERKSGYYSRPWQWEAIRKNAGFIDQFGSTNDPYIPWREMQFKLHKFTNRGHFSDRVEFTEVRDVVLARIKQHHAAT